MKSLKSLFLVIFLFNFNCFANDVKSITNNEMVLTKTLDNEASDFKIKDKNKEDISAKQKDVKDYINNPKEYAEKFWDDVNSIFFTALFLLALVVLYFAKGNTSNDDLSDIPKIGSGGSRRTEFIKPFEPSRSSSISYRHLPSNIHYRK